MIAGVNVDSGRAWDFHGHVLLASDMNLGGYTLESHVLELSLRRLL